MLMEAQDENFDELDLVVRQFQQAMLRIKYAQKPVVAAPFNMTLGGGAEVCLHAPRIQASMETYIGLVEVGVGLIPGGGGSKELYVKHLERLPQGIKVDLQDVVMKVFETVAMAKVSASAEEARENGFLSPEDSISVNPDHLLYDAKQRCWSYMRRDSARKPAKRFPSPGKRAMRRCCWRRKRCTAPATFPTTI